MVTYSVGEPRLGSGVGTLLHLGYPLWLHDDARRGGVDPRISGPDDHGLVLIPRIGSFFRTKLVLALYARRRPPSLATLSMAQSQPPPTIGDLRVEPMTSQGDVEKAFDLACATFGRQTKDGIFMAMNPGWETAEGWRAGARRFVERWQSISRDCNGNPSTVFLKASVPDPSCKGERRVIGSAIWVQASAVEGRGVAPVEDVGTVMDLEALHPGDVAEQAYVRQLERALHRDRNDFVRAQAKSDPPAVFVLDMCVVDPAFQGRGAAKEMVRWGIREAHRRGCLDLVTEGSAMGRRVYEKLGFQPRYPEIEYHVDPEFETRDRPSNVFMHRAGHVSP